mgnify:FL=1
MLGQSPGGRGARAVSTAATTAVKEPLDYVFRTWQRGYGAYSTYTRSFAAIGGQTPETRSEVCPKIPCGVVFSAEKG